MSIADYDETVKIKLNCRPDRGVLIVQTGFVAFVVQFLKQWIDFLTHAVRVRNMQIETNGGVYRMGEKM